MTDLNKRIADLNDESLKPDAIGRMHLLQASAGTGKTYSIQSIYLRLILIEGMTVQQILTVTFTKDATKELRDRLQGVLREALDYLNGHKHITDPDDRTKMIVDTAAQHAGETKTRERLRLALLDFDMAAVYTIHGFCQRVLKRFAFETKQGFDIEPASKADDEIEQLCEDWWRNNVYTMDRDVAGLLAAGGTFSLKAVTELAKKLISKPDAVLDDNTARPSGIETLGERVPDGRLAAHQAALKIKQNYQSSRASARSASFNDYLINLREALKGSDKLVDVLREEFHAALIDEFQDTDPIQWGIFEKLFKGASIPCFLVGDPKQAIYRFRNGDIETYVNATRSIESKYELNTNHRSEERLIDAVNQIFMDTPGNPTFGESIAYRVPLAAAGKKPEKSLLLNGKRDEHPLQILLITKSNKPQHSDSAFKLTAQEIAKILSDKTQTIGGCVVEAKDIAVLVNKHKEAEAIARALKDLNIPSVRQGTGDVWQTDEGRNLRVMLEAILDARNLNHVRTALHSSWGGMSSEQIQLLNEGGSLCLPYCKNSEPYAMEHFVETFVDLRDIWQRRGYPAMFRKFMSCFELKQRLLKQDDKQGQRRLANITHLSELVERKIIEDRKTPEGILAWVRRQFSSETADDGDDSALRLENDDNAVRIMTIFTSKGLQFPIVFAPTLFMMNVSQRGVTYEYHDADGNLRIVRKTDNSKENAVHKAKERREIESEQIRQIYVALTRAIHRTVVIAFNSGAKDGRPRKGEIQKYKWYGPLGNVLRLPLKADDKAIAVDLDRIHERFENVQGVDCAIEVRVAGEEESFPGLADRITNKIMDTPPALPEVDTSMGHGSFSSITPHEKRRDDEPVTGASAEDAAKNRDSETLQTAGTDPVIKPEGIFTFPSGARTGTCWHAIFEDLDFKADDAAINTMVETKLRIHGFLKNEKQREERITVTAKMVANVLRTPLAHHEAGKFSFSDISACDRKNEWEFSFAALPGRRTQDLKAAIGGFEDYRDFTDALGEWNDEIPGGFLTGFLDLLFRRDSRYYIADWKSNRRSGQKKDFYQAGLKDEISLHRYWLQYLIYTVAVHQYLSKAMPGYKYEDHFGGIYYVFLRGVDGSVEDGYTNGIYYDLPPLQLIENMSEVIGDFS